MIKRIREGILDEVFKPGDHLGEIELAEKFQVQALTGPRNPPRFLRERENYVLKNRWMRVRKTFLASTAALLRESGLRRIRKMR